MNNWPDELVPALERISLLENRQIEYLQELKVWTAFKIKRKKELTKHIEKMLKSVKKDPSNLTQEMINHYICLLGIAKISVLPLEKGK